MRENSGNGNGVCRYVRAWYSSQVFITLIRYKNNVSTVTLERVSHDGVDKTPPFQCYPCFSEQMNTDSTIYFK